MDATFKNWIEKGYKYVIRGYDEKTGEARFPKQFKTRRSAEKFLEDNCNSRSSSLYLERPEVHEIDSLFGCHNNRARWQELKAEKERQRIAYLDSINFPEEI